MIGSGTIVELVLLDRRPAARIRCAGGLVPAAGQYLLGHRPGSDATLPDVLFRGPLTDDGFVAVSPLPNDWLPGVVLNLRGPLGHGFTMPEHISRLALIAFNLNPRRLLPLADLASRGDVSITIVCEEPPDDLDRHIEVQQPSALVDVLRWADYAAIDIARQDLPKLGGALQRGNARLALPRAQVLVRTAMPCGALADCGVCAVKLQRGIGLACDDGPVFDLDLLDLEGQ